MGILFGFHGLDTERDTHFWSLLEAWSQNTRSERNSEKGTNRGLRLQLVSAYGSVYLSERKTDGWTVAIKEIQCDLGTDSVESELQILKSCNSEFIVRYDDAIKRESSLWVRFAFLFDK